MQNTTKLTLTITLIILSLTIGCDWGQHTEILIIGPYTTTCFGPFEQECYLEFNEEAEKWHFFYDEIIGFNYEEGFIWTLKVRLEKLDEAMQDAGLYDYYLVEVLKKEAAPIDVRPPRKP